MKKTILSSMMAAGALAFATTASAAPVGLLSLSSGGAGVRVTATTIDWVPLGGGTGTMITDFNTDVDYTGGNLVGGTPGMIKDLPPVPSDDFMTFAGHPLLSFDLLGLGPASAIDCGDGTGITSGSCSFNAFGSPFILTYIDADTTGVALGAFGTATDGNGVSLWDGSFTTQVQLSINEIYTAIYGGGVGYVNSGYSGEFDLNFTPQVPEPASMLLLGLGFTAAAVRIRRRR